MTEPKGTYKHYGFCEECLREIFKGRINEFNFEQLNAYFGECRKCGFKKMIWKEPDLRNCIDRTE